MYFFKKLSEIKHPRLFLYKLYGLFLEWFAPLFSDKLFLKMKWRHIMGYPLNLEEPKTFNEKLQWLKLYNHKPEYTLMVDKAEAKKYVANIIGERYIIPTIAVYTKLEDIDFNLLPRQFVIKCTHDSGGVVICKDKDVFDMKAAIKKLRKGLRTNFYSQNREWPYKNLRPRIIVEKYMVEDGNASLNDYKLMCFNGVVKLIELHKGRFTNNYTQDFYDRDWNKTPITQGVHTNVSTDLEPRPVLLDEMIELSERLSKGIPHVRVDWYIVNNHLYFGELTFFDGSGFEAWDRYEDDLLLGSWITLPPKSYVKLKDFGVQGIDMFY